VVLAVAWVPSGDLLATGSSDGAARLWNAHTGELLAILRDPGGRIGAVLFLDDGHLLTGSDSGGIQTWLTDPAELIWLARDRLAR
jgi:WD40 repeat protein